MNQNNADSNALLQLRAHYAALRNSEKRVADYILKQPNEIIYLSISALAEKCRTSETSVIRLCKAIGYSGFQDFKINIAKALVSPTQQIHEDVKENDPVSDIIRKVMTANIRAIQDTMEILDAEEVQKAIHAIASTSRLELYGVGGSGPVALDGQHKFFKYGVNSTAYIDPHMQVMSASTMKAGDVVLGISHTGSSKDIVESLSVAKQAGATTICITGGMKSPVTHVSDIVLNVIAREQSFKPEPMSSRIAQLSVIDVLAVGVALTRPDDVLKTLDEMRRALGDKRY